jgi:hypothetical protein
LPRQRLLETEDVLGFMVGKHAVEVKITARIMVREPVSGTALYPIVRLTTSSIALFVASR